MRIFCLSVLFLVAASSAVTDLPGNIEQVLDDSSVADALVGIAIYDISSDSTLYSFNANKMFRPASNLKLFTSAAALGILGADFRFETKFLSQGAIDNRGRLQGDLVIVGGGDPLISGRFRSHITEILEFWADSLKANGINEIKGGIVVDNSLFEGPDLGPGWSWDDLTYWYACPASALSFNDNCVDLHFFPGKKPGDPAIIEKNPSTDYIEIHNKAYTLAAESSFTLDYYRTPHTNEVTFFGGIPADDTLGEKDYVSVHRPEIYAATVFRDVLRAKGVKADIEIRALADMDSSKRVEYSRERLHQLFTWESDSLGVVVSVMNTNSQNFFAEQTLKTMGVRASGEGSFEAGVSAVMAWLDSLGISSDDLSMYDGSGLSYMNLVMPEAIIRLLIAMSKRPDFGVYFESLGNPAEDRALRKRLENQPSRSSVRAKTGYMAGASAFSGYVKGPRTGHLIAYSIMINDYNCPKSNIEAWEDRIVEFLLRDL